MGSFRCGICLVYTSLMEGDYFVNTQCGHIYHFDCIRKWIGSGGKNPICPVCRETVSLRSLVKLHGVSPTDLPPICPSASRTNGLKIALIGDSGCGKTSLLLTFARGMFPEDVTSTCGCDVFFKTIDISGKVIKLSIWDCGGQDRFAAITPNFIRNIQGIIVVYDISRAETFANLCKWFQFITNYAPFHVPRILIGNKSDMDHVRQVSTMEGQELAQDLGISFLETSAKEEHNVEASFRLLAGTILETSWNDGQLEESIQLTDSKVKVKGSGSRCTC